MKKYVIRFFEDTELDQEELVLVECADSWDRQDQIDALWEQESREKRFDGVEWIRA